MAQKMNYSSFPVNPVLNILSGARAGRLVYRGAAEETPGRQMAQQETIGDRARTRRLALGLTPTEVARRVQSAGRPTIKIQHIRKLENNQVRSITYLAELAVALECDPLWLSAGVPPNVFEPAVDTDRLALAWDAVETVIAEHGLSIELKKRIDLAIAVYSDLTDDAEVPAEVARSALFRFLVEQHKQ